MPAEGRSLPSWFRRVVMEAGAPHPDQQQAKLYGIIGLEDETHFFRMIQISTVALAILRMGVAESRYEPQHLPSP